MDTPALTASLDDAVRAICPIDGVSIGDPEDRSTWRIDFQDEATETQRAAALAALQAFTPIDEMSVDTYKAMIRRRAADLQAGGKPVEAFLLLKTIGE